jgi:hypothetical protein
MQISETRGKRRAPALLFLSLCIALFGSLKLFAAIPKADLPYLSLTGRENGYDNSLYSDGRLWLGYADDRVREVLVPVYIKNLWYTRENVTDKRYSGFPIYTFTYSVLYDSRVFEAAGGQFVGPRRQDPVGLAQGFELEFDDVVDTTRYGVYVRGSVSAETKYGRRLFVTGRSTKPLPVTDEDGTYRQLMYLRFKVTLTKAQLTNQPTRFNGADKSALYISNDSLMYNDFMVGRDNPFPNVSDGDQTNPYKDKSYRRDKRDSIGLAGVSISTTELPEYPSRPGVVWVNVGEVPTIAYRDFQGNGNDQVAPDQNAADGSLWNLVKPLIIDSAINPRDARRDIILFNSTARSRLTNINVRSDSPWLFFQTVAPGFVPIRNITRDADIDFIDNGINGPVPPNLKDARNQIIAAQDPIRFRIIARTGELRRGDNEYAGIYIGYITVTSLSAKVSPVKLKVTFIHLRNPIEPGSQFRSKSPEFGLDYGIKLSIRNSRGAIGDTTNLVFGTGHRATDGPDSLFGEYAYDALNAPTGFFARWFTPWVKDANGVEVAPNGLGDVQLDADDGRIFRRDSRSRDIRDFTADSTLFYLCRFDAAGVNNYPIVITWDVRDFPEDAQLFLRDTLNGGLFSVDMREATPNGDYERSFTIRDAKIKSFIIEYRLPGTVRYPVVNKGWNFLSLPLRPSNPKYQVVYPNAINKPYIFSLNQYQPEENMRPGIGYFIKFGDKVDSILIGSRVNEFSKSTTQVRLFEGWNSIGAPSTRVNVGDVSYESTSGGVETLQNDIYSYTTNRGYTAVSELRPGLGYWVKVLKEGFLRAKGSGLPKVVTPSTSNNFATIAINDAEGKNNELKVSENSIVNTSRFELPPVFAPDMFDVRFTNNAYVANANEMVVRIQGATYPVTLNGKGLNSAYVAYDATTGAKLGTISHNGNVEINNSNVTLIKLAKVTANENGVEVFPNPASSMISVRTAGNDAARAELFDVLGNIVKTVTFTGSTAISVDELSNGTYTIRITSAGINTTQSVVINR